MSLKKCLNPNCDTDLASRAFHCPKCGVQTKYGLKKEMLLRCKSCKKILSVHRHITKYFTKHIYIHNGHGGSFAKMHWDYDHPCPRCADPKPLKYFSLSSGPSVALLIALAYPVIIISILIILDSRDCEKIIKSRIFHFNYDYIRKFINANCMMIIFYPVPFFLALSFFFAERKTLLLNTGFIRLLLGKVILLIFVVLVIFTVDKNSFLGIIYKILITIVLLDIVAWFSIKFQQKRLRFFLR